MSEDKYEPTESRSRLSAIGSAIGYTVGIGVVLLGPFVGAVVLYRIYPDHVADNANPGFIDNIFDNNLVVFAARLVLLSVALVLAFVGTFVVASVVKWMRSGEFLTRAAGFEVSQRAIRDLEQAAEFWQQQALALNQQVAELSERLEESDALFASLLEEDDDEDEDDDDDD